MNRKLPKGRTNNPVHEKRKSFAKWAMPGQQRMNLTLASKIAKKTKLPVTTVWTEWE